MRKTNMIPSRFWEEVKPTLCAVHFWLIALAPFYIEQVRGGYKPYFVYVSVQINR